jgi:hypothetical protein
VGALPYLFLRKDAPVFVVAIQKLLRNYFEFGFEHHRVSHLDSHWDWVVYNLPDALWAFSLTSFIVLATRKDSRNTKLLYLSLSILVMLVLEINVGTFDWLDLAAMIIGSGVSIAMVR